MGPKWFLPLERKTLTATMTRMKVVRRRRKQRDLQTTTAALLFLSSLPSWAFPHSPRVRELPILSLALVGGGGRGRLYVRLV